jgi:lipopolysaccharide transport system permease protein
VSLEVLPERETPALRTEGEAPISEMVIEPQKGWTAIEWSEIWRYRELLYFLTWRDVKIRYKQTALGGAWAIIQPLANTLIFTLLFGKLAGLDQKTGGVPYAVYVYTAQLAWTFFANSVNNSSNSLVGSANLISKVYFPRLIIPLAAVGAGLVDFAVSAVVLLGMMLYFHTGFSPQILLAPLFLVGTILCATGVGTLLSALTVAYRDFRYVVPFMVQLWFFATPVIYPNSMIPAPWRNLMFLNPMTGLVDGFRSTFLGLPIQWGNTSLSLGISLACFLLGATYFRAVERRFADII